MRKDVVNEVSAIKSKMEELEQEADKAERESDFEEVAKIRLW